MSLDVKKDIIFNTFNGLEEQLSDPDPVKEVRNYRWALRQQTIMFQNFLNEMKLEREAFEQSYAEKYAEEEERRNELLEQLRADLVQLEEEIKKLEETHRAEIIYQSSLTNQKLREQEDALRKELQPRADAFAKQIRDVVRQEELAGAEKHLRELFVLTQQKALDLSGLSNQLREYADSLDKVSVEFSTYLKENGAKEFKSIKGSEFNPSRHEIVMTVTDSSQPFNTIVEVHENGYAINRRPLVRAKVTLNVAPKDVATIKKDIRASEKEVRQEIKELIETYQKEGDVELVRRRQREEREYKIGDPVEEVSNDVIYGDESVDFEGVDESAHYDQEEDYYEDETPRQRRKRLKAERKAAKKAAKAARKQAENNSSQVKDESAAEYDETEDFDDESFGDTEDWSE